MIKLKVSHNEHIDEAPANSWHWLIFSIILIFSIPFIVETVLVLREKYLKEIEKVEEKERKKELKNKDLKRSEQKEKAKKEG